MLLQVQVNEDDVDADDWDGLQAALKWQPDPVELGLVQQKARERNSDILTMLVSVYGSRELFINEYRCLSVHASPPQRTQVTGRKVFCTLTLQWHGTPEAFACIKRTSARCPALVQVCKI